VQLYVHWGKVRQAEGVSSYADRILINAFIDERRRFWRSRETSTAEFHDPEPVRGPSHRGTGPSLAAPAPGDRCGLGSTRGHLAPVRRILWLRELGVLDP
jgi:hypothetical protein